MSIKLQKLKTVYSSTKTTYKAQTASLLETCKKKSQNNRVLSNILKYTDEFSKNPSMSPERCQGRIPRHTLMVSFPLKVNVPSVATSGNRKG